MSNFRRDIPAIELMNYFERVDDILIRSTDLMEYGIGKFTPHMGKIVRSYFGKDDVKNFDEERAPYGLYIEVKFDKRDVFGDYGEISFTNQEDIDHVMEGYGAVRPDQLVGKKIVGYTNDDMGLFAGVGPAEAGPHEWYVGKPVRELVQSQAAR